VTGCSRIGKGALVAGAFVSKFLLDKYTQLFKTDDHFVVDKQRWIPWATLSLK